MIYPHNSLLSIFLGWVLSIAAVASHTESNHEPKNNNQNNLDYQFFFFLLSFHKPNWNSAARLDDAFESDQKPSITIARAISVAAQSTSHTNIVCWQQTEQTERTEREMKIKKRTNEIIMKIRFDEEEKKK